MKPKNKSFVICLRVEKKANEYIYLIPLSLSFIQGNVKKRIGIRTDKEEEETEQSDVLHAWTKHISHS